VASNHTAAAVKKLSLVNRLRKYHVFTMLTTKPVRCQPMDAQSPRGLSR